MGYAYYETPLGPAGYSVEDTCHRDGCTEEIDRGLGQLCGDTPGVPDEYGCGEWFCDKDLYMSLSLPDDVRLRGGGLCAKCVARWEAAHPELVAAADEWLARVANG